MVIALKSVLLNLSERGITPLVRKSGGQTVLKYSLGGKKLVQQFNHAGDIVKFKSYGLDSLGQKTITKGDFSLLRRNRFDYNPIGQWFKTVRTKLKGASEYSFTKNSLVAKENLNSHGEFNIHVSGSDMPFKDRVVTSWKGHDGLRHGSIWEYFPCTCQKTRQF